MHKTETVSQTPSLIYSEDMIKCDQCYFRARVWHEFDADPINGSWKCSNKKCTKIWPFKFKQIRPRTGAFNIGTKVRTMQVLEQAFGQIARGTEGVVEKVSFTSNKTPSTLLHIRLLNFSISLAPYQVEKVI